MRQLLAAVLFAAACAASAAPAPHALEVRIYNGKAVFSHIMKLAVEQQDEFAGTVTGSDKTRRSMVVNARLNGGGEPGRFELPHQIELSGGRGSQEPSIQVQGSLRMASGSRVRILECGAYAIELSLDAAGTLGAKKAADAAWDDAGLGNYRLTAEVARGRAKHFCRHVMLPNNQGNVVDSVTRDGRKHSFILNSLAAPAAGGAVRMQYQIEDGRSGEAAPLKLQREQTLMLGRRSDPLGPGKSLTFLIEGGAPRDAPKPVAPAAPAESGGAVPLLR